MSKNLPETGPRCAIEISIRDDVATLTLDTTGVGLHKRGYRSLVAEAQLRETLAATLVQLSFWRPGRVLADPFCGTGTIPIEAALLGRNIAPGLRRMFAAEDWPTFDSRALATAREEARDLVAARRCPSGCWVTTSIRRAAQLGPISCGAGRCGRRHPLAGAAVHRFAGEGRVRLHRHQSAVWRADGDG